MTAAAHSAPNPLDRIAHAIPVAIRDNRREVAALYSLLILFVAAVVVAVLIWGLPALVLAALALVPVVFALFIIIARP